MDIDLIGWDIGGAHLKAAAFAGDRVVAVTQKPCPLWLGLEHFHAAARAILDETRPAAACRHAVTMTGELVDLFSNRAEGVFALLKALGQQVPSANIRVFAGPKGFLSVEDVTADDVSAIASANWLATGLCAARQIPQGLLIDIGSTTADVLVFRAGDVLTRGYTDSERMRHGELVYCGVVRTPLMALAQSAPFGGEWIGLMAEHFATTADVYRLTGELPGHADQGATADGTDKTLTASARRIARLLGHDVESADIATWQQLAAYFRERQLARLTDACLRQTSRGLLDAQAPFIGSGVGRFLVQELAARLRHPFLDFAHPFLDSADVFPTHPFPSTFHLADCAPAVAVAYLARRNHG